LKLVLENVNLNSNSGPNSFGQKLFKYMPSLGVSFSDNPGPDAYLCFIESGRPTYNAPLYQRLDGIYFNSEFDYETQNSNIKRTYNLAKGVIFQSQFNKELTFNYFGPHSNYAVIHNGADIDLINSVEKIKIDKYENIWSCASSWRPHKRLSENIRYFLEHAGPNDGMIVAGKVDKKFKHERIHYVGELSTEKLFGLYKASKYFIHLAWLDHCPNVVVDAMACGCQIICSSAGGTKEIAGSDAIIIQEDNWDFSPIRLYNPPRLNFTNQASNKWYSNDDYDMISVSKKYYNFIKDDLNG
jgi:glycosyltransferase involved in cell wall biosynthesis